MVGAGSGKTQADDGGLLGAVDKVVSFVENAFTYIAAGFIFTLMFFLTAEVLGRKLFNSPIPGAIDWVEVWMATFAFMGAAYCQRLGGHVRMEMLISKVKGRLGWWMEFLAVSVAFVYVLIIINHSFKHFVRAWEWGDSTIDVQLMTWPSKLIVPVALTLLAIRLLLNMWGYVRMALNPNLTPVAVPLTKTAADIARGEIEDALGHDAKDIPHTNKN
jgi:C4-dicarboxylate transporter, DctQ subunit